MTAPDSRDSVELLPCPFCGSEAERIDFGPGSGDNEGGSCIACTKCQASGPVEFGYKENFVANWNRRDLARGPQQAGGEDSEIREILFGALDRNRDNITTRGLVVVAVNALQRERERAETAEAALREAGRDAERLDWIVRRFDHMKTSEAEMMLSTLRLQADATVDLRAAIDAALNGGQDAPR